MSNLKRDRPTIGVLAGWAITTGKISDLMRPVTLSFGISVIKEKDIEADVLVRQADMALYEAKRRGRDRICIFMDGEFKCEE